jgi:DNA-3-methyladenine glycosylase
LSRLAPGFFARESLAVALDLLGCRLVHETAHGRMVARIVEVEAYLGDGSDPASHAHGGQTRRNASMFGPPGRFYVYRSMGLHFCANLVCEPAPRASAVLLRAVEPLEGEPLMQKARGGRGGRDLTSGPGKLCQAFGISLAHDGATALRGPLRVEPRAGALAEPVLAGPRIGISKAADLPYRFFLAENPFVTRSALNRAARPVGLRSPPARCARRGAC